MLSEAAQNTFDLNMYQQWLLGGDENVQLGVDVVRCCYEKRCYFCEVNVKIARKTGAVTSLLTLVLS